MTNAPSLTPDIEQSVLAFSKAFRQYPSESFAFGLFSWFPQNCCEYASLLLAWFLSEEHQCTALEIVKGRLKDDREQMHLWLRLEGQNIDITADQFNPELPPVLVTQTGGWHDRYSLISVESFDDKFYEHYHDDCRDDIIDDYRALAHLARQGEGGTRK